MVVGALALAAGVVAAVFGEWRAAGSLASAGVASWWGGRVLDRLVQGR